MILARLFQSFRGASPTMSRPMSRDKADMLLLLFSCALVIAPHISHLPVWVTPLCGTLLLWRGWITFRGNRMPPRWLLLPIAVFAMLGVFISYKTLFGRDAGVAMLTLLLTLKLLEMHARRDLFVALFLSFFLILASFFYSQSIATAVMTIVAAASILTTQLSFQYTGTVPPLTRRFRLGAMILAMAAPLTIVLFLLFPRIQGPLWGMPNDAQQNGRTGLSEHMSPGNIARLALSDDIAFRVKFTDPLPPKNQLYWRGVVLGDYDGRTWTALHSRIYQNRQILINTRGTPTRYQITLEPHGRRWLFALDVPQALPEIAGNASTITPDLQILSTQPINERIRYDLVSQVDYDLQPKEPPQVLWQWLRLPEGFNPRTLEFAAQLRKQAANNVETINAALSFFREQPFRYTLEPPALGTHVIDEFLFSTRAGFCEHYSAAFVVLMRAAGIPARVVMGYQGGEINPADGFLTVRQSDAHAWAEVWLEQRGWVRVDPTAAVAPNRVEQNLTSVIPRRMLGGLITFDGNQSPLIDKLQLLRQNWEAVTNAWNQWVLNYTPEKQKNFFKSLGFDKPDWRIMIALMFALGAGLTVVVMLPLILRQQKRDPVEAIYQKLCKEMARQGYPRAIHEGPRDYGVRLTSSGSHLPAHKKDAVARFLQVYETVRYGAPDGHGENATQKHKSAMASPNPSPACKRGERNEPLRDFHVNKAHSSSLSQLKNLFAACR